ncbi:GNAT family N-acetyltransferase [Micromonospora sp. NPDC004704]
MSISYMQPTGQSAALWFEEVADLYATVYSEAPYEEGPEQVDVFRSKLPEELSRPGFELVVAVEDDSAVGVAYGWTMPAGTWWSSADREPPPNLLDADKFALMEWIVHPSRRGEGVGAELIRRLIDGRPESWATLASDPRSAARSMYERAGWRDVGRSVLPWGPAMDLLALFLPSRHQ